MITKSRVAAIIYIAAIFYLLPFGGIWLTRDWDVATFYEPTVPEQVEAVRENGSTNGENTAEPTPNNSQ